MKRRTFSIASPTRLSVALARELGRPAHEVAAFIDAGAVYVGGKRSRDGALTLKAGAQVSVVLSETGASTAQAKEPRFTLTVIEERRDWLAVNKPAGWVSQPTPGRQGGSLLDAVSDYLKRPAGLVHRLDKETSGVMVFGKSKEGTRELAAAFREGTAKKRYLAVAAGALEAAGDITLKLSKDPSRVGRWRASAKANGIEAHTRFERLYAAPKFTLVALYPLTGRTHQLRAHLAALEAPIWGDTLYDGPRADPGATELPAAPRCLLHAQTLHVLGSGLEAPLPDDMQAWFSLAKVKAPPIDEVETRGE